MSRQTDDTVGGVRHAATAAEITQAAHGDFDRLMRQHHAQALDALSPQTRSRLRATRRAAATAPATSRHGLGWILASGSAAVLALAIAVQWQRAPVDGAAPVQVAATAPADELEAGIASDDDYRSLVAGLDENPDLYLWLAANHDTLPLER